MLTCVVLCAGWNAAAAGAQQRAAVRADTVTDVAPRLPMTTLDALQQMELRAGVVFAGEVVAIRRVGTGLSGSEGGSPQNSFAGNAGAVEVEIHIEDAVRGCTAGGQYVLREWPGLWVNQGPRYRVGQRAVWLLHAPNAAGMSSPVGGMVGVLPVTGRGARTLVDLRWMKTQVARQLVVLPDAAERQRMVAAKTVGGNSAKDWKPPVLPVSTDGEAATDVARMEAAGASRSQDYNVVQTALENPTADYTTLLGVLHGMEAARDAAQR